MRVKTIQKVVCPKVIYYNKKRFVQIENAKPDTKLKLIDVFTKHLLKVETVPSDKLPLHVRKKFVSQTYYYIEL
jgi:hypothetical protein